MPYANPCSYPSIHQTPDILVCCLNRSNYFKQANQQISPPPLLFVHLFHSPIPADIDDSILESQMTIHQYNKWKQLHPIHSKSNENAPAIVIHYIPPNNKTIRSSASNPHQFGHRTLTNPPSNRTKPSFQKPP